MLQHIGLNILDKSEIEQYFVWYDFDLKDIFVNPGETYFIVWEQQGYGDEENKEWWFRKNFC